MKKILKGVFVCLFVVSLCISAVACVERDAVIFSVEGEKLPQTIAAELNELIVPLKVQAEKNGERLEVTLSIEDSAGQEVLLTNGKFRASDMNGYRMIFTAGEESTLVTVTVSDTKAPTFRIMGTSGSVILLNQEAEIPECTVIDASADDLVAEVSVVDPNQQAVAVTDGKFLAEIEGRYTILYSAVDGSGNVGRQEFIYICKNAVILNDFERVEDIYLVQDESTLGVTEENALHGSGVKVEFSGSVDPNGRYRYIRIPLKKADGSYYTWEELLEFEGVQVYVYLSAANELGLSNFTRPVAMGKNILYYSIEELKAAKDFSDDQYQASDNGFFLNVKFSAPNTYMIFDYMIGVYPEGYVNPVRFFDGDGSQPETVLNADYGDAIILPALTAYRDGVPAEVSCAVFDSSDQEVEIADGKFIAEDVGGYRLVYTATDALGSAEFTVEVKVRDTRIPVITVKSADGLYLSKGGSARLPDCSVEIITGEEIVPVVTVTDPNGDIVSITDGCFDVLFEGEYLVTYTAISAEGHRSEEQLKLNAVVGELLNDFRSIGSNPGGDANDFYWTNPESAVSFERDEVLHGGKVLNLTDSAYNLYLPLRSEGKFADFDHLGEFEGIDIILYSSCARTFGLPTYQIFNVELQAGWNRVHLPADALAKQYAEMKDGFYKSTIQGMNFYVSSAAADEYLVFAQIFGIYGEDYVFPVQFGEIPSELSVEFNTLCTPEPLTATRGGVEIPVTVAVYAPDGSEVVLENDTFIVSQYGVYRVVYTAKDDYGSASFEVTVTAIDSRKPELKVDAVDGKYIVLGALTEIPACQVSIGTEEELEAAVTVTDPEGNAVEVTGGKFLPGMKGRYTVTYFAESQVTGNSARVTLILICIDGRIINAFEKISGNNPGADGEDLYWVQGSVTISRDRELGGAKIGNAAEGGYGIYIPLKKADGSYYSMEELQKFASIELRIYSSTKRTFGLSSHATFSQVLEEGWNTVTIGTDRIASLYEQDPGSYSQGLAGMKFYMDTAPADAFVVLGELAGLNPERIENGVLINAFENISGNNPGVDGEDLYWVQGGSVTISSDDEFGGARIQNLSEGATPSIFP